MSDPVVMPSGATVTYRAIEKVTERYRRPIVRLSAAFHASGASAILASEDGERSLSSEALGLMSELNDAVAVAMIESWSYDMPVSPDSMLDLVGADYDFLRAATAPYVMQLLPDFDPTPDPESPTAPSQP